MFVRRLLLGALSMVLAAAPALGQSRFATDDRARQEEDEQQQQQQQQDMTDTHRQPGKVAESTVGRVGQRQTSEDVAPSLHPMRRISNRIENRVQSRIRNRIDRNYDPQANANSPFAVAEEEARAAAGR